MVLEIIICFSGHLIVIRYIFFNLPYLSGDHSYKIYLIMENNHDPVNHPKHYTSHPSGIECIDVTQHHNFCIGNAIKYLWRAGLKEGDGKQVEDLKKAVWYIEQEIKNLSK